MGALAIAYYIIGIKPPMQIRALSLFLSSIDGVTTTQMPCAKLSAVSTLCLGSSVVEDMLGHNCKTTIVRIGFPTSIQQ
jgi:hypothetical protein